MTVMSFSAPESSGNKRQFNTFTKFAYQVKRKRYCMILFKTYDLICAFAQCKMIVSNNVYLSVAELASIHWNWGFANGLLSKILVLHTELLHSRPLANLQMH